MSELKNKIKNFLEHSAAVEISKDTQITVFKKELAILGGGDKDPVPANFGCNDTCSNKSVACSQTKNTGCTNYGANCEGGTNRDCINLPAYNYC